MVIYGKNCSVLEGFLVAAVDIKTSLARICLTGVKKLSKVYNIFFANRSMVVINKQTFILSVGSILACPII